MMREAASGRSGQHRRRAVGSRVAAALAVSMLVLAACLPAGPPTSTERSVSSLQPPGSALAPAGLLSAELPPIRALRGPVPFPIEANVGQAPPDVTYLLRAGAVQVGFANGGPRLRLSDNAPSADPDCAAPLTRRARTDLTDPVGCPLVAHTLALELIGAEDVAPIGSTPSDTVVSWFHGRPDEWQTGIAAYDQVAYRGAWPGIDALYERAPGVAGLEATYVVGPGADPSEIRLAWHGADAVRLDESGALVLTTPVGVVREAAPTAWQERADGSREPVPAHFRLLNDGTDGLPIEVGFTVGQFDASRPLVIDPVIAYAGYIGGAQNDNAQGVALDPGCVSNCPMYVVGQTFSAVTPDGFPATGGPSTTFGGNGDAFVAKVKPDGSGLIYAGYIGGSQDDTASGVAVDSSGAAYVVGSTHSNPTQGFPAAVGPSTT